MPSENFIGCDSLLNELNLFLVQIDTLDIEPDPEPPSPIQLDRGPSPEAKPDDTECHRSQSAM